MQKKALVLGLALAAASSIAMAQPQGGHRGGPGGPGGERMKHLDTDGDGRISLAEQQAGTEQRFKRTDANSDGYITQEEMQASRAKNEEFRKKMQELRQQYRH